MKAIANMDLCTRVAGRQFEVRRIEETERVENDDDMVERNAHSGTFAGCCQTNLADNQMKRCNKLDIEIGCCWDCHMECVASQGLYREQAPSSHSAVGLSRDSQNMAAEHYSTDMVTATAVIMISL